MGERAEGGVLEVAVVGGGPAGAAVAIALARAGRTVAVLERSRYDQVRVGETLSPRIRLALGDLGVWERFVAAGHAPSPGVLSAWGGGEPYERHFIFNPYGCGWHVDRGRFDAMLALAAEDAGASIVREARVTSCRPATPNGWRVEYTLDGRRHELWARFLVDASGRAAVVARWQGARRICHDRLVGVVDFVAPRPLAGDPDPRTLVEAVEDGWWYSAQLPDSRLVVAYMTDADLLPRGDACVRRHWRERLEQAPHTHARLGDGTAEGHASGAGPRAVSANSFVIDPLAGRTWVAVGDAAAASDPLSSRGIYNAIQSGLRAAGAIDGVRSGDEAGLVEYVRWTHGGFDEYLRLRAVHYGRERRWPSSRFWQRRRSEESRGETQ